MLREIVEPGVPKSASEIDAFARRHGLMLPATYAQFLRRSNGGQPIPSAFPIAGFPGNPLGVIQAFFGLESAIASEDLDKTLLDLRGVIPFGVLPIACTEGDDFVCLDLRKPEAPIVFWDRKPFWGRNRWSESDIYPVAQDFESFLHSLVELKC